MNRFGTLSRLTLAFTGLLTALPALAQPARTTDTAWARDVQGATITLDGTLNEPQWAQAQVIPVRYNNTNGFYTPGGGWDNFFGNFNVTGTSPTDPVDADVRLLRSGNTLWIGVTARDRSVGGAPIDFWTNDGLVLSIQDKRNRAEALATPPINFFNGGNTDEFFYSYFSADTTAGSLPNLFGNEQDEVPALWDGRTTVQGTSNNDSDTDTGYTQELRIDLATLGIDMTRPGGDRLPMTFVIFDFDYKRSAQQYLTRGWWQNGWGGDMPYGVAFVYGRPDVTVSSGTLPAITEPELRLPTTSSAITINGRLNEGIWGAIAPQVTLKYQPTVAELDALPGFGPFYTHWFRPGGDAPDAPPVVDATAGRIRMFHQGDRLVVGLDTDDQAVSGAANEDRGDGLRIVVRERNNVNDGDPYLFRGYLAFIDSTGGLRVRRESDGSNDTTGNANAPEVQRGLFLKAGTTVSNPDDIDTGYQMELSIDLTSIPGYTAGLGDRQIWIGAAFFDGDQLPDDTQSYGMRTWWLTERGGGPFGGPAAQTYLDPAFVIADEGGAGTATGLRVVGSVPNPTGGLTALRYVLPDAADVTVEVFDVLGRRVATMAPGLQTAGEHAVTLDASALAPGAYAVRVRTADGATAAGRLTVLR
jgi:hypothetical protein